MKSLTPLHRTACILLTISCSFGCKALAEDDDSGGMQHDHLHHHHFAELAEVPARDRARSNPLEIDQDAIPAGRKLFAQHCAQCHGNTAEGSRKAPNLRAREVQDAPQGSLFWILSNGVVRRGMPDWSNLPEPRRWQIITFLKSLGASPEGTSH